tara:strand:- start:1159 stop:2502 length:1344 start_codon:yes stop_codon:yes gene_type:complete
MGRRDVSSRALPRKEDDDDDAYYYYWDDDDVNDVNDEFYDAEAGRRRRRRRRLAMRRRDDNNNRRASSSKSVSRGTKTRGGERVAALIDGGEVFFISSAVAMKARQVYVEQRARGESSKAASNSASTNNALMDVPLYVAVVVGAVLRRASNNNVNGGVFSSSVFANGIRSMKHPTTKGVNARVENLEVGFERLDENQARYSRDVSRLGTRVRLTRRELSPMIRRAEATSVKFGAVATELSRRVEVAEEEGRKLAETMASLHAVSAKQFEVLSKSVRELRAAIKELEMEAEEAAMMTIEEEEDGSVPSVSSRRSTTSNSRYAKKEEVEKLERMLTEALDEMEDCLTTMVREKAVALGQEIDDISLLEDDDDDDDDDDDEKKKKEEDEKELVWAGESSGSPQTTTSFARDDEETDAAEPPSIQLYKFEDFESTPTPTNDDTNADKNTSE